MGKISMRSLAVKERREIRRSKRWCFAYFCKTWEIFEHAFKYYGRQWMHSCKYWKGDNR